MPSCGVREKMNTPPRSMESSAWSELLLAAVSHLKKEKLGTRLLAAIATCSAIDTSRGSARSES